MASVLDFSTTASSNTAVGGVGVAGTDLPSNLDDAIRMLVALLASAQPRANAKNANYTATKDDMGKAIVFTGANRVLTIPAISTLATGWNIIAEADASNALTINRSGSNTLNGETSLTLAAGTRCYIYVSNSSTDLKVDFMARGQVPVLTGGNTWTGEQSISGGTPTLSLTDTSVSNLVHMVRSLNDVLTLDADVSGAQGNNNAVQVRINGGTKAVFTYNGLYLSDFGSVGGTLNFGTVGSSNDRMYFSDDTNMFTFEADGSAGSAILSAGALTHPLFGAGPSVNSFKLGGGELTLTRDSSNLRTQVTFVNPNGTVGSITTSGSATAYLTASDARLKHDFKPIDPTLIEQIKVYDFEWKSGDGRAYGVVAQELYEVLPQAVGRGKAEDDMWSVDLSKIVPLLVAALKDVRARLASLEHPGQPNEPA